jgi:hypothetical protein
MISFDSKFVSSCEMCTLLLGDESNERDKFILIVAATFVAEDSIRCNDLDNDNDSELLLIDGVINVDLSEDDTYNEDSNFLGVALDS